MKHPHILRYISSATAVADRVRNWNPRCMVLYYHVVPENMLDNFRAQLDLLCEMMTVVPANADPAMIGEGDCVAITFDDCFASTIERVMPLFRERLIPVTLFVPASRIGQAPDWPSRGEFDPASERIVSQEALSSLAADGLVTVGSHGFRHIDLSRLDERSARAEFASSRNKLESITERPVRLFSFPYGRSNTRLVQWAREAGYTHIFGTEPKPHDGTCARLIGRVRVDPWDSERDFMLKVRGAYRWLPGAQSIKRKFIHERELQDVA